MEEALIELLGTHSKFIIDSEKYKYEVQDLIRKLSDFEYCYELHGCFDWYWGALDELKEYDCNPVECELIFGFYTLPNWIESFVEQFNSLFKNIKLSLLWTKEIYLINGEETVTNIKWSKDNDYLPIKSALFKINYSDSYPIWTRIYTTYYIHHLIRQLSYAELEELDYDIPKNCPKDPMKIVIKRSNSSYEKERSLSYFKLTTNDLLKIDDIEQANKIEKLLEELQVNKEIPIIKQTVIGLLFQDKLPSNEKFKTGETIKINHIYKNWVDYEYSKNLSWESRPKCIDINAKIIANFSYKWKEDDLDQDWNGTVYIKNLSNAEIHPLNMYNLESLAERI